jgi:hypothetical protein
MPLITELDDEGRYVACFWARASRVEFPVHPVYGRYVGIWNDVGILLPHPLQTSGLLVQAELLPAYPTDKNCNAVFDAFEIEN